MTTTSQPLPYTDSPYLLAIADLVLWARITFVWPPWNGIPSIILPILPFRSGALDELYPTPANLYSLILQLIFTLLQALFLISIPVSTFLGIGFPLLPPLLGTYVPVWLTWIFLFIVINHLLSTLLLDGTKKEFFSQTPLSTTDLDDHKDEKWVFVNGVAAGSHWMQSNIDRLSLTFHREILGIYNPTRGILFDVIECIVERTFSYPTPSTRTVYTRLLDIVSNPTYNKIILIIHSQGAIEGGLALDWLFATVPADQLRRVEVYTFGSAANHFNNPISTTTSNGQRIDINADNNPFQSARILRHIEHYANSGDYVSKFGILNFRPLPASLTGAPASSDSQVNNRYVGRLFIRHASGHQLNGNYLDNFFRMDSSLSRVLEGNPFMDGQFDPGLLRGSDIVVVRGEEFRVGVRGFVSTEKGLDNGYRVKDVSRLWMYRNGMSPEG